MLEQDASELTNFESIDEVNALEGLTFRLLDTISHITRDVTNCLLGFLLLLISGLLFRLKLLYISGEAVPLRTVI